MKINNLIKESIECVKIKGIYRNLNNDEMKLYKKIKDGKRVFKKDLPEFYQTVATNMVIKGLLSRKKEKDSGFLYYTTKGRHGNIKHEELDEVAPPDREIESWIKKNKQKFQDRYGDGYEKYLYGKAWKKYNGKPIKESEDKEETIDLQMMVGKKCINNKENKVGIIKSVGYNGLNKKVINKIIIEDIDTKETQSITLEDFEDNWIVENNIL